MSLTGRLLRQPNTRYSPTPDDLTVLKSELVMVKGPDGKVRDELDHLWYQVEEREAGCRVGGQDQDGVGRAIQLAGEV